MVKPRRVMLDTSACVELLRASDRRFATRIRALDTDDIAVSSIVVAELAFGVEKSGDTQERGRDLTNLLRYVRVVDFDRPAAHEYGRVRHALSRAGRPIGELDMLIGSHALSEKAAVATLDVSHFRRIPGLHVEDWGA